MKKKQSSEWCNHDYKRLPLTHKKYVRCPDCGKRLKARIVYASTPWGNIITELSHPDRDMLELFVVIKPHKKKVKYRDIH